MLRKPLDRNRRPQPNPEGIARAVRGLDRLVADPLAWRWRDGAYQDYVGAQFSRAYGTGPAARDETGKLLPADPILTEIEPYRPQARPEDSTPAQPVGPDRPNRPGDVLGLQKALSAAGRYVFDIAGGERAGAYSDALRSAIEGFQAEAGAKVDGAVAPGGETAPLLRRALWPEGGPTQPRAERPRTPDTGLPIASDRSREGSSPHRLPLQGNEQELGRKPVEDVLPPEAKPRPDPRVTKVHPPASKPKPIFPQFSIDAKPREVWPESPLSVEFRNKIRDVEQSHSYEEFFNHPDANVIGALGLYQLTDIGLKDIGMIKEVKNGPPEWTGKDGIESIEEFLAHPYVQEIEFAEYVEKVRHYLRDNGPMRAVGEIIDGFVAPIKITEPGLIAAAHRWGVGNTRRYLDALRKKDWDSEAAVIGSPLETEFRAIEYRLRLFQNIPLEPGASSDIPSAVPTP